MNTDATTVMIMMMGLTCLTLIFIAALAAVGALYMLKGRPAPVSEQEMMLHLLRQLVTNSERAGSRQTLTDVPLKDFESRVGRPFLDRGWHVETWWANPTVAGYGTFIIRKDRE